MAVRHRSKQLNQINSITSYEAAKAVVRRDTEEIQSNGNFDVFVFADDFLDHTVSVGPGATAGNPRVHGMVL
jgi:hypothetical protein